MCACLYVCPVAFGWEEGDWEDETFFYALDQCEIGHTHALRAKINFTGQDRTVRGYVFISTGDSGLYARDEVYLAILSLKDDSYSLRVREMKGISSTLSYYLKRKSLVLRRTIAGTDKGSLFQIDLDVVEGLAANRSGLLQSRAYRLARAAGHYEITSRPRLESGDRQVMTLDLSDARNPFDRSSFCAYLLGAAARWLERREAFIPGPIFEIESNSWWEED